jgi:hypothetical protein
MGEHFITRTNLHIKLVNEWYWKIRKLSEKAGFVYGVIDIENHDISKFSYPEHVPYITTVWSYLCKEKDIPFKVSDTEKKMGNKATIHHITFNKHHPEYWDENFSEEKFNPVNRDAVPENPVDATKMPMCYVQEMLADWLGMSTEKGSDPYKWAELNINKRWMMTEEQVEYIYFVLDEVWTKKE